MKRSEKLSQKRREAAERQERYDALTPEQKYERAVTNGHPNTREALRLKGLLNAGQ